MKEKNVLFARLELQLKLQVQMECIALWNISAYFGFNNVIFSLLCPIIQGTVQS